MVRCAESGCMRLGPTTEFEKAWEELSKDFAPEVLAASWSKALAEIFFERGYNARKDEK